MSGRPFALRPFGPPGLRPLRPSARASWGRVRRDQSGATAIEFGLIAAILVFLLLNGVDLGRYLYLRTQVENAAQAGAHWIWEKCDPMKLPVMTRCYSGQSAAQTAVAGVISSVLAGVSGDQVTLTEGFYCTDAAGALHSVTNMASLPTQCVSGAVPGDYIQVRITYGFAPLFGNLTVAQAFGTSISMTSYMRLQ